MSSRDIAFLIALGAGAVVMYPIRARIRGWLWRNLERTPTWLAVILIVTVAGGFALAAAGLVPQWTIATIWAGLVVVAVIWGWVRYRRSSDLGRWETTWRQVESHLASDDAEAADRVMMAAHQQDDAERERLRTAAPRDRGAALDFQRRTKAELEAWNRTAELYARTVGKDSANSSAGAAVFSRRRQSLEADLDWIGEVLKRSFGAA